MEFILASLLPKLRDKFAEFLQHGSLKRLRLLDVFTSVGLQYGDIVQSKKKDQKSSKMKFWSLFGTAKLSRDSKAVQNNRILSFSRKIIKYMKINPNIFHKIKIFVIQKSYPSNTAFAFFLGAVWLCVDLRSTETFELSAIMFFTWLYVTHVSILTSDFSKIFYKISSSIYRTFCYQFYTFERHQPEGSG